MRIFIVFLLVSGWANAETTRIQTVGKTFEVKEGAEVELPCIVENLVSDGSIYWKRGTEPIAVDDEILSGDDRFEVRKDDGYSTLVISNVEPIDAAEYRCAIVEPEIEIIHKVVVVVPPRLHIAPDSNPLMVTKGDFVVLRCTADGNPPPQVKWAKKAGVLGSDVEVTENSLRFNASSVHSGEYICTGKNSAGTVTRSVTLQVADVNNSEEPLKPWVKTELSYLPVSRGQSVNVTCQYDGSPPPMVEWLFNGYKLKLSEEKFKQTVEYDKREANFTVTILEVKDMTEDSFGDYMCRATNNLGSDHKVIHVSGRPGPPRIELDGHSLSMTVQSREPVIEFAVLYRSSHEDTFNNKELFRSDKRDEIEPDVYHQTVNLLPYLKRGEKYQLQVEARNLIGWGSMARDYITIEIPAGDQEVSSSSLRVLSSVVMITLVRWLF